MSIVQEKQKCVELNFPMRFLSLLFLCCMLSSVTLHAEPPYESYASLPIPKSVASLKNSFYSYLNVDFVTKAKIHKHGLTKDLQFIAFCVGTEDNIKPVCWNTEALSTSFSYTLTNLGFDGNPFFGEKIFNTLNFSIIGFSSRMSNWDLKAQAKINMNILHLGNTDYYNYDLYLWGRYHYNSKIGLHAGALVATGMNINRFFPILGFDWQVTPSWQLNVIYPVNISLQYTFNCNWKVSLAGRYFFSRNRAGEHHRFPKGLYFYRAIGSELAVNYIYNSRFIANLRCGYTFATKLTVADKNYKQKERFSPNASPYVGVDFLLYF